MPDEACRVGIIFTGFSPLMKRFMVPPHRYIVLTMRSLAFPVRDG